MEAKDFIPVIQLCSLYKVETSFFNQLNEEGLIEIITVEKVSCLHQDSIIDVEKMIRIHHELNINIEGIDVVFNLLHRVDDLQSELIAIKNRLRLYEND
jgi:hypothetical protein